MDPSPPDMDEEALRQNARDAVALVDRVQRVVEKILGACTGAYLGYVVGAYVLETEWAAYLGAALGLAIGWSLGRSLDGDRRAHDLNALGRAREHEQRASDLVRHHKRSPSWLKTTHQMWKAYLFLGAMAVAGALLFIGLEKPYILLIAVATSAASMTWLCLAIRCPTCGHRPVWSILTTADASVWFTTILRLTGCPTCLPPSHPEAADEGTRRG